MNELNIEGVCYHCGNSKKQGKWFDSIDRFICKDCTDTLEAEFQAEFPGRDFWKWFNRSLGEAPHE